MKALLTVLAGLIVPSFAHAAQASLPDPQAASAASALSAAPAASADSASSPKAPSSPSSSRAPRSTPTSSSASAPISPNPTPVSLPSYSGLSPSGMPAGGLLGAPMCGGPERQELEKITALNQIETQKSAQKLRSVNDERDDAAARYNALFEKQKLELSPMEFELHRMQLESNIQEEKFKKELAEVRQERERLHIDNDVAREKLAADQVKLDAQRLKADQDLAEARQEREMLHVDNDVAREKLAADQVKLDAERLKADAEKLKMDVAMRDLDFESRKLRMDAERADHETVALRADLDLRTKKEDWKKQVNHDPDYETAPFKDGVLTITDRRIALDGPIVDGVADFVTDRIHYFNNKDEKLPIFIVIDRSPGGSVMEGYRIVKAMLASKAPVHVVVKSYAASMAAVITTLAPHSYTYPNAVILHHQISDMSWGNLTQQKEQLKIMEEWYKRLADPVAKKAGMSLDAFTAEMYKHNSDGNWEEFGDAAVKLKWVDNVVHEIRETGVLKEPGSSKDEKPKLAFGLAEETDPHGARFVRLPRLQPFDAYWIDNTDGYYR